MKLGASLSVKGEPTDPNLPLLPRKRSLLAIYKHLSIALLNRMEQFKALSAEHLRICRNLGEVPKTFTCDSVPSVQLLETMDAEINALLIKLAQRYAETSNRANEIGDCTLLPNTNEGKTVGRNLSCLESSCASSVSYEIDKQLLSS